MRATVWRRRFLLLAAACALAGQAAAPRDLAEDARDAMERGDWDAALGLYERLREAAQDLPQIPYNMGVAAFKAGDLERAEELFRQALSLTDDPAARARTAYNLGTTAYARALRSAETPPAAGAAGEPAASPLNEATEALEGALDHFREALDGDPEDVDARANAELARRFLRRLEEMKQQAQQQQQQQQQQEQQDQEQKDEPQEEQDDQPQSQQQNSGATDQERAQQQQAGGNEENEEQEQPQPTEQDPQAEQQERPEEGAGGRETRMTREEAERLLQHVRDKERERREALARSEGRTRSAVEKDW